MTKNRKKVLDFFVFFKQYVAFMFDLRRMAQAVYQTSRRSENAFIQ